jgi:hypothetical protein
MPPAPKPPGQRVRRNVDQKQWVTLPAAKPFKRPPTCPTRWSPATKKWWKLIWESPMAAVWLESDIHALTRLGNLIELQAKGKISAIMVGEIRQIEDRFGLSPKSRRMLQLHIPVDDAKDGDDLEQATMSNVRRLRAV